MYDRAIEQNPSNAIYNNNKGQNYNSGLGILPS